MTKYEAIKQFLSGFGLQAYDATIVPDGTGIPTPEFPYLTFYMVEGAWESGAVAMQVDLWYRSLTPTDMNAKSDEIGNAIGLGGVLVPCDGGAIWIKKGSPFAQNMSDPNDDTVKRKYINLAVEYLTQ